MGKLHQNKNKSLIDILRENDAVSPSSIAQNRAILHRLTPQILDALSAGYSALAIWQALSQSKRVKIKYRWFLENIKRLKENTPKEKMKLPSPATVSQKTAKSSSKARFPATSAAEENENESGLGLQVRRVDGDVPFYSVNMADDTDISKPPWVKK